MKTIQFLFGTQDRVTRKEYFLWGLGLMLLKYSVESLMYYSLTKNFISPLNFLSPLASHRYPNISIKDGMVGPLIILWSIPFIWIGVGMSLRRAVDAGKSPWWSIVFFVPFLNLILMAILSCLPGKGEEWKFSQARIESFGIQSPFKISLIFVFVGVTLAWFSANVVKIYGTSLFVGIPLIIGLVQGYNLTRKSSTDVRGVLKFVTVTIILIHLCLLVFALEGVFCLAMSFPIAWFLAAIGGVFGHRIALFKSSHLTPTALMVLLPLTPVLEKNFFKAEPSVVMSSIHVNASPEKVWPNVVKFPDLDPTDDFFFRMGIATPLRARIEGTGVGAIRHCEFTTGSFVEPITAWEEPTRLAFDVKEQPAPMKELSFYEVIDAPHLKGFFRSIKGEFRLVRTPAGTELQGRTWYEVEMGPQWYWQIFGEYFIHKIHLRVLGHVKKISEA